jgi:cytoskeleton protein RodZ
MSEPTQDGLGPLFNAPDAGNQGPGDMLRRAREAQRISIEVMAANIKVSVAKLEALESGRYDMLPDANFTRALAMTLCRVLKIDAAPVLAAMPAARPITLVSDVPPLNQPFKASRASMSLFDHRVVNWSNFLKPQWLSPAALLLAAVVLYTAPGASDWPAELRGWWQARQAAAPAEVAASMADVASSVEVATANLPSPVPDASLASAPADASSASDAASSVPARNANGTRALTLDAADAAGSQVAGGAPVSVPGPAPAAPVTPSPAPAPAPAPVQSSQPNGLLSMHASQPTWVEVKDAQGNRLLGRLIQRDETVDLSVPPPLTLRVGNAGGLSLSFQGKAVDLVPYTRNNIARLELK